MYTLKKLKWTLLYTLFSIFLVLPFVSGQNLTITSISDTIIGNYNCNGGSSLNDEQFAKIKDNILYDNYWKRYPLDREWGVFDVKNSDLDRIRFRVNLSDNDELIYINLMKDYWIVSYDLHLVGDDFEPEYQQATERKTVFGDPWGKISVALSGTGCREELVTLIYQIYASNILSDNVLGCELWPDYKSCADSDAYNNLMKQLSFGKMSEGRIHTSDNDAVLIFDLGHLGSLSDYGLGKIVIISDYNWFNYGIEGNSDIKDMNQMILTIFKEAEVAIPLSQNSSLTYGNIILFRNDAEEILNELRNNILEEEELDYSSAKEELNQIEAELQEYQMNLDTYVLMREGLGNIECSSDKFYCIYYGGFQKELNVIDSKIHGIQDAINQLRSRLDVVWSALFDGMNLEKINITIFWMKLTLVVTILLGIAGYAWQSKKIDEQIKSGSKDLGDLANTIREKTDEHIRKIEDTESKKEKVIINSALQEVEKNIQWCNEFKDYEEAYLSKGLINFVHYKLIPDRIQNSLNSTKIRREEDLSLIYETLKHINLVNAFIFITKDNEILYTLSDLNEKVEKNKKKLYKIIEHFQNDIDKNGFEKWLDTYLRFRKYHHKRFVRDKKGQYKYDSPFNKRIMDQLDVLFGILRKEKDPRGKKNNFIGEFKREINLFEEDIFSEQMRVTAYMLKYLSLFEMNSKAFENLKKLQQLLVKIKGDTNA